MNDVSRRSLVPGPFLERSLSAGSCSLSTLAAHKPKEPKSLSTQVMENDAACMDYDHLVKVVMLGDSGVGKTALVQRYVEDDFTPSSINTIGVDLRVKTLRLDSNEDKKIKMQIWDTAGQERFRAITQCYYRGADAFVLVTDLTEESTVKNLPKWIYDVQHFAHKGTQIVVVANKSDYEDDRLNDGKMRVVNLEDIRSYFDKSTNVTIVETSAKTGKGVKDAFMFAAQTALERVRERENPFRNSDGDIVSVDGTSLLRGGKRSCPCTLI